MCRVKLAAVCAITAIAGWVAANADVKAPRTPPYATVMQNDIAAEHTTADYLMRPYLIDTLQFVAGFVAPSDTALGLAAGDAAFSFKIPLSLNLFGSILRQGAAASPSWEARVGVGLNSIFGAGLMLDFNKVSVKTTTPTPPTTSVTETKTTYAPDGFGVFGGVNVGFGGVFADVSMRTGPEDHTTVTPPPPALVEELKSSTTSALLGWRKEAESEGSLALGGDVQMNFSSTSRDSASPTALRVDSSSSTVMVAARIGTPLKKNDSYSVFTGGDLLFGIRSWKDNVPNPTPKISGTGIGLRPNIAFQKELGKGFEASLGASVYLMQWLSLTEENIVVPNDKLEASQFQSIDGQVSLGLRWARENFAVEGQLNPLMLSRGPYLLSGGVSTPMFATVGVSLGF